MDVFKIAATGVSVNYMPEYLAEKKGYFKELGLDVINYTPNPWTEGLVDINQEAADVVLGGIWVPIMYKNHVKDYLSVAKIASKCPLYIVSKEPMTEEFHWSALENKRVLVTGGDGASHYLMVTGTANAGGADTSKIRFIHDFSSSMLKELFLGGFGDFIVVQPDTAHELIEGKKGYFFCELASAGSNIPWSVYYGLPERIDARLDVFSAFVAGVQKGTTYLLAQGGEACRDIIAEKWPNMSVEEGIQTIDLFIKKGMWTDSVAITKEELDRWQDYLIQGDVLDERLSYETLIDARPFENSKKREVQGR